MINNYLLHVKSIFINKFTFISYVYVVKLHYSAKIYVMYIIKI